MIIFDELIKCKVTAIFVLFITYYSVKSGGKIKRLKYSREILEK